MLESQRSFRHSIKISTGDPSFHFQNHLRSIVLKTGKFFLLVGLVYTKQQKVVEKKIFSNFS